VDSELYGVKMKKITITTLLLFSLAFNLIAQTNSPTEPKTQKIPDGFVSDGCSHFPDGDYKDCCVAHDVKYYYGGSWTDRWRADNQLRKCVAAKNHKVISVMMWLGVRAFGVPWLPTKFRWGFGKDLAKK
jgi:hypothetical protein